MKKLSIIIPFYNTPDYTEELLTVLEPQLTEDVEVMLIDDGTEKDKWALWFIERFPWLKVMRTEHRGQSAARNLGLNNTCGEYIQFIDSDDLVPDYFIEELLKRIPDGSDVIEYSWEHIQSGRSRFLIHRGMRNPNISVCTRCFKYSFIGNVRFNEQKDATEDEDFARHVGLHKSHVKASVIEKPMYYYRRHSGSTEDRFKSGKTHTKRIIYYYNEVTADRTDILDAIREDDKTNQVFLMTYKNEIPELADYCQVIRPCNIWAHEAKGEQYYRWIHIRLEENNDG